MAKAPLGALVSIYIDTPFQVEVGHAVQTTTGRTYLVMAVYQQKSGIYAGRWHIKGIVIESPPPNARVHIIHWYGRNSKSKSRRHGHKSRSAHS